eukprot:1160961-Pelagomonas_calceolata.AAC.2
MGMAALLTMCAGSMLYRMACLRGPAQAAAAAAAAALQKHSTPIGVVMQAFNQGCSTCQCGLGMMVSVIDGQNETNASFTASR